jgi:deoxyribodipyrimidine photo-lyase
MLHSFLHSRGTGYSRGISSPNTAWTSCSRLSPYFSWGHISIRFVIKTVRAKRTKKGKQTGATAAVEGDGWGRSLAAFLSRMHWRAHFMQKLEAEPLMEKRDLCPAFQPLRRQPGDWNDAFYKAWSEGKTGFPFVDACMRCLLKHGWMNFRMRAMLVSFATW